MEDQGWKESSVFSEIKKQLRLATPLAVGCLMQKIIMTTSIMFVGHLGELALASVSLATSFAAVTGFSLMVNIPVKLNVVIVSVVPALLNCRCALPWQSGMASSLDTLCGQAFGAEQFHKLGIYRQRAMLVLALTSTPVAIFRVYTGEVLVWFRQDPEIAAGADSYIRCLIPALFLFGQLQCSIRFLQSQNVVVPVIVSSAATAAVHIAMCWLLVRRLGMGINGAALANTASNLFNLALLEIYVRFWASSKATWTGFSNGAFRGMKDFLKLAVPSALMLCMEWWAFELLVLLSGLLPNPKLETAVISICFHTYAFVFMIPMGLGAVASIRVSNELGAGRPQMARLATRVVMLLAFSMAISEGVVMVLLRNLLGYMYSSDKEVAVYTARAIPITAVLLIFDSMQCVLSGIVRGCGWQKIGAFINLGAYYLAGIPAAAIFAFVCHLRGMGLWLGILCGVVVQMLLLLAITLCTHWDKEALKAADRVFSATQPINSSTSGCCIEKANDGRETIEATKGSVNPNES